ncbi:MAG: zinc-dependent alcohol dehydrogenase [Bacillota bacterium]
MKALRKTREGKGNVKLEEVDIPEIKENEVLMKVWAGGVCGSDLLIQKDRHFYEAPVTLGHEFSGIVEEKGKNVNKVEKGDKIVADIETESGWLGVTRDGGFAPYMAVPEAQIYKYSDDVSLDHACFTEPVVATIHSMQERNDVKAGDFVVVVGPGPMGLLGVQFAKIRGASAVALIGLKSDEKRLEAGKKVGADYILYSEENPEETIREITNGKGADFVLECSASEKGVQHAIDCARPAPEGRGGKGKISFISLWGEPITINADPISLYQLTIHGSWSWNGSESWQRAVDLISRGVFDFDPLISRYQLEEWEDAFQNQRNADDVKAFIHPHGEEEW